jgi:hypothetical protein
MTQRDFLFAMHQYSKEKFNIKEATPSLCQGCGECCSDNVQFFKSEIKQLKKKYKKFFRGVETIEANEDTFRLVKNQMITKETVKTLVYFLTSETNNAWFIMTDLLSVNFTGNLLLHLVGMRVLMCCHPRVSAKDYRVPLESSV